MPKTRDDLGTWLDMLHAEQAVSELDQLADLWIANGDAKAIKDPWSPAFAEAHGRINAVLDALGL